ncbi:MAG: FtsW/RodA/SpoVE family cell cycle protein [Firmicutes bacterium HGW-Firmicutes-7]|nr:MAG: FtsW/RodA/SpoVE family cell cycle protein [Firmicutes bacterium HGW-Firmicutes-7]
MLNIFINLTRYFFLLCSFYFFYSSIKMHKALYDQDDHNIAFYYNAQRIVILLSHFVGFIILVLTKDNTLDLTILYIEQLLVFMVIWGIISRFHYGTNLLLWNISLYFIQISYLILTRLDYGYGVRQFKMVVLGYVIALIIPKIFHKLTFLAKLEWVYLVLSIGLLVLVNDTINGSKNWMTIGSFSFQPSEFVKIVYVLFIASFFRKNCDRIKLLISGFFTAGLVLLLVFQKDLGTALMFFVLYITLVYIQTNQPLLFIGGLTAGSGAAFIGYKLFAHVRVRVEAWSNPWADIDNKGYQITQSLFAIGAGGWLGTGLSKGLPNKIPVVMTDFIFSAISEEFGNLFSIFLIAIIMFFFLTAIRMCLDVKDHFSFLVSAGISVIMAFQQILIIGGVTKFIPITGVTLPFISYGGTSLIASCIMLGILQGVYLNRKIINEDDEGE